MFGNKNKNGSPGMDIDTLIGARTTFRGDIHFSGGLRIDGTVQGILTAEAGSDALLMLSDKGSIEGEVRVPHVIINGVFIGDIIASERVELAAQARVTGDIFYKVLEMAPGAQVTGRIMREEEPRKQLSKPEAHTKIIAGTSGEIRAEAKLEAWIEPGSQSRLDAKRA